MIKNGFTLIELLVVVAIIGIIASIGVVAYNGYTAAAKKFVVETNHNEAIKLIKRELARAEITGKALAWRGGVAGSCILVKVNSASHWVHTAYDAFSCLSQNPANTNPFNSNDTEGAFWTSAKVPNVSQIGRTACYADHVNNFVRCNSRWGTNLSDIITTTFKNF